MSISSENIIPGITGQIFETNAKEPEDLEKIKNSILSLDGIKDVIINTEIFPREFTVHTTKFIKITAIENKARLADFHAIPKSLFSL